MTEIEKFLLPYRPSVDGNGRIHISCVCDGTLLFAMYLKEILEAVGCTDIELDGKEAEKSEIPKNKPWCSYKFFASGLLPKAE